MLLFFFSISLLHQILFAAITAFAVSVAITSPIIGFLRKRKLQDGASKKSSEKLQELHEKANKSQTPTMGGLAIVISIAISCLLWMKPSMELMIGAFGMLSFFALGFYDDWMKLNNKGKDGLSFKTKIFLQTVIAMLVGVGLFTLTDYSQEFIFLNVFSINLGWGYLFVVFFIIVGTSNAANLTDGLDGLASGTVAITTFGMSVLAYFYYPEMSIAAIILCAVLIGFLWYNFYPAKVFMGDTGSLSIGFVLGYLAILLKIEILMIFIAGILFAEALSVILQVLYYKKTKKRIFLCAPLHHHFEFKNWSETQIVIRFWIISLLLTASTVIFVLDIIIETSRR
ncbi:MAG: phospho-N-acetylmuramoyl-pentapeptide-transferase [Planctomycetes bacterium]|nr:phospho-N-acetylmuramoyl-pentapeptide-transferase [Planctomycetota bacterium]